MEIEIVKTMLSAGVAGAVALIIWKQYIKTTDFYFNELKAISEQHRDDIVRIEADHRKGLLDYGERLEILTEKAIEAMVRVELIAQGVLELLQEDK